MRGSFVLSSSLLLCFFRWTLLWKSWTSVSNIHSATAAWMIAPVQQRQPPNHRRLQHHRTQISFIPRKNQLTTCLLSNTNTTAAAAAATTTTTKSTTTTPSTTATRTSKTTASSTTALIPDGGLNPCVIRVLGVGGAGCNAVGIYLFFRSFRIRGRGQLLHP